MREFKIECEPERLSKYQVYRKEYKLIFFHYWKSIAGFGTFEEAETEILELKKFPKYYEV